MAEIIEFDSKVSDVKDEASDTKTITIPIPEGVRFEFKSGQFVMIKLPHAEIQKAYSISSMPGEKGFITITVKDMGYFSHMLCSLEKGNDIHVRGPFGHMVLDDTKGDFVFIAGGSGIAPFMPMIKFILENNPESKIYLFYTCRTSKELIFNDMIKKLSDEGKIFAHVGITRPQLEDPMVWKGPIGRINIDLVREKAGSLEGKKFFLCSTPTMVSDIRDKLLAEGIKDDDIRKEQW